VSDWRADVLKSLPDRKVSFRIVTFESALELIDTAAFNRRMHTDEFVGRAALAVAAHDQDLDWGLITRQEPPLRDLRRHGLPPKRLYGRNFGPWTIGEMS
jgi:hypothetical protein